jgi:mitotic spindle assembly checkpoint protein MAD2
MTSTVASSEISLKGSAAIVTEFFGYAVNSIIFQRGLYPADKFKKVNKYGLTILISADEGLNAYISQVMGQMSRWLLSNDVEKLVLVITGVESSQTLERWVFNVETTDRENVNPDAPRATKSEKEIATEISAIIRQITGSVTFLPHLEEPCTFDLLVYTRISASVPTEWEDSDAKYISNSTEVTLRSFTTKVHKVQAMVSYRQQV